MKRFIQRRAFGTLAVQSFAKLLLRFFVLGFLSLALFSFALQLRAKARFHFAPARPLVFNLSRELRFNRRLLFFVFGKQLAKLVFRGFLHALHRFARHFAFSFKLLLQRLASRKLRVARFFSRLDGLESFRQLAFGFERSLFLVVELRFEGRNLGFELFYGLAHRSFRVRTFSPLSLDGIAEFLFFRSTFLFLLVQLLLRGRDSLVQDFHCAERGTFFS